MKKLILLCIAALAVVSLVLIASPMQKTMQETVGLDTYTRADMCLRVRDFSLKFWDADVQAMCRAELADYMKERRVNWDRDWREAGR